MTYQVIARKWRPQSFDDLVGQQHVTQTLTNALKNGRIHHALLFTGPRGTGKTSSARILAKALRCPKAQDFVPCNECDSCQEISASRSMDVQELDAASHNSVEDIRQLLGSVVTGTASGLWKIFIIDEVHMLSTSAFNALLKTLEEPPAHVLFILATTEVHKIPETILSRCLRFDFKRISTRQITDRLLQICASENVSLNDEAAWLIARQGDGSMRDALSLLDQVITFANGALDKSTVTRILGLTDRSLLYEVLQNLLHRDTVGMAKVVEKISISGLEPKLFSQELLESLRNLLIVKVSTAEMTGILDLPDSELKDLAEIAAQMTEEEIHLLFDMTLKGANDIPKAQDPRLVLEMLLLRMASAPRIVDLQSLLAGSAAPTKRAPTPSIAAPTGPTAPRGELRREAAPQPKPATSPAKTLTRSTASSTTQTAPTVAAGPSLQSSSAVQSAKPTPVEVKTPKTPEERWVQFIEAVRAEEALFAAKLENLIFGGVQDQILKLSVPAKMVFLKEQLADANVRGKLKGFLDRLWGPGFSFEVGGAREQAEGASAQQIVEQKKQLAEDELKAKIAGHPMVVAARKTFGGEIKSITPLKEGAKK